MSKGTSGDALADSVDFLVWSASIACIFSQMAARKRQNDVVFEPIMCSPAMKAADRLLRSVAAKDVVLTLIGESGAGKEVLARRAHEMSNRRTGPFVPINCAAIPETLFESELFGHERGAFTGANERTRGKIESAETGTLFLDEIGEMPPLMQPKLLRFLENRRYMRVGGSSKIDANIRLMTATLRPLEEEVQAGRFRADLFYRIQGITLRVPPLRERQGDILPLLNQFVDQLTSKHQVKRPKFSTKVKSLLLRYEWPGNVRELRNVVETLCLLREGRQVRATDMPESIQRLGLETTLAAPEPTNLLTIDLTTGLQAVLASVLVAALQQHGGDKSKAAAMLGISLRTIQRYVAQGLCI